MQRVSGGHQGRQHPLGRRATPRPAGHADLRRFGLTKIVGAAWAWPATRKRDPVAPNGIQRMYLPVAHGEGKFIARDAAALARLEAAGQLALRYTPLAARGEAGGERASSRQPQRLDGKRGRRL